MTLLTVLLLHGAHAADAVADLPSGLILHVANGEGDSAALAGEGRHLVLALTPSERLADARVAVQAAGKAAQVTVEPRDRLVRLPVADHLARAVAIDDWAAAERAGLTAAELLRAVAPYGRILVRGGSPALADLPAPEQMAGWTAWRRPLPADMGEWTHDQVADGGMTMVSGDALDGKLTNTGSLLRLHGDGYRGALDGREAQRQPLWPRFITGNDRSVVGQASFVVAGGRIFCTLQRDAASVFDGERLRRPGPVLVARDAASGLRQWTRPIAGSLLAGNERVLLVAEGGRLHALDPADGRNLWSAANANVGRNRPLALPLPDGGAVIATGMPRRLSAAGAVRWQSALTIPVAAFAGDLALLEQPPSPPATAATLHALAIADGSVRWTRPMPAGLRLVCANAAWAVLDDGTAYEVVSVRDGSTVLARQRGGRAVNGNRGGQLDPGNAARLVGDLLVVRDRMNGRLTARHPVSVHRLPDGAAVLEGSQDMQGIGYWLCNGEGVWTAGQVRGLIAGTRHPQADPAGSYAPGGTCGTIFPVAYRTAFQTPLNCVCGGFSANIRGMLALAPPTPPAAAAWTTPPTGEPGAPAADAAPASGWPTFRGDPARSAAGGAIAAKIARVWAVRPQPAPLAPFQVDDARLRAAFPGPLTPPVLAGGVLAVGMPDSHAVVALNAADGSPRWRCELGATMDGPPTLGRGMAFIGSHDGRVQAIRLDDGRIAWRSRITPVDERMVAWGHVQDRFPAIGSVVLADGRILATAGISGEIGVMFAALDPATGNASDYRLLPRGAYLNDVLVADQGGGWWLGAIATDPARQGRSATAWNRFREQLARKDPSLNSALFLPRLDAKVDPIDPASERLLPLGEPLIATARTTAYDHGITRTARFGGNLWGQTRNGRNALFWAWDARVQVGAIQIAVTAKPGSTTDELPHGDAIVCHPRPAAGAGAADAAPAWRVEADRVWALALAGDAVVAAGPRREDIQRDPRTGPGRLEVRSLADGSLRQELPLPAPPVQDGIAVADGMIVVACWDGTIVGFR